MLRYKISEITKEKIIEMVENSVQENKQLDYKEKLPGNSDVDKKEFLADVVSFANTNGGDIIYGIPEKKESGKGTGLPAEARGLPGINIDSEMLRLENIIRSGVAPRITGITVHPVPGFKEGPILILRIERSWNSPHMVTYKGSSRFYCRNSSGKYQLDIDEIRNYFTLAESLPERMRNFRMERLSKIMSQDAPIPLSDTPMLVVHAVPFEAAAGVVKLDPRVLKQGSATPRPAGASGWNTGFNLDGLVKYSKNSYVQMFRNGITEYTEARIANIEKMTIYSLDLEDDIINIIRMNMAFFEEFGMNLPCYIFASLCGVKGYKMGIGPNYFHEVTTIDRNVLTVPEIVIEEKTAVDSKIRELLDFIWQSAGHEQSIYYDENGARRRQ